jgi:general secretion pathway protein C
MKLGSALMHMVMLAVVCAIGAYWGVKLLTPLPTAAPPPVATPLPREPEPVLAARMFGLVQQPAVQAAANIQVTGLFAAGRQSAALLAVDGKPPRAYVVGQRVSGDTVLAEVSAERVVLDTRGARQELPAPARPAVAQSGGSSGPAYLLEGNVLTAPGSGASAPGPNAAPGAMRRPAAPGPQADGLPGMPQPAPVAPPAAPIPPPAKEASN